MTVGLVGLGLLGSALRQRLVAAGHEVFGYDIDAARKPEAASATEVAARCPCLVLCLPHSGVTAQVLDEVAGSLQPGALVIDTTTGEPEEMAAFGARLARNSAGYVDATIGGSSKQVLAGENIVIAGGTVEVVARARVVLDAIGRRVFHAGPAGSGAAMKLVLNLALGLNRAVLAEALTFAGRCGIAPEAALEVLQAGPAYSRVMDIKGERMLAGRFGEPDARLSQHLKDVRLILQRGAIHGAPLPLSALHEQILAEVERLGHGGEDNSAVIRYFQHPNAAPTETD